MSPIINGRYSMHIDPDPKVAAIKDAIELLQAIEADRKARWHIGATLRRLKEAVGHDGSGETVAVPFAWAKPLTMSYTGEVNYEISFGEKCPTPRRGWFPVYPEMGVPQAAAPAAAGGVPAPVDGSASGVREPLTDEEILSFGFDDGRYGIPGTTEYDLTLARCVERKHGIGADRSAGAGNTDGRGAP